MATRTGIASRFAVAVQTTDDITRTTPDNFFPTYLSETFAENRTHIPSMGLGQDYLTEIGFALGPANPGGGMAMELIPQSTGVLLYLAMGAVAEGGGGGPTYTHTFTPADPLPAGSVQVLLPDSDDGTLRPKDLVGAKCASWSISCDATGNGAMVAANFEWLAHKFLTDQSAVAASWPGSLTHWSSVQASMTIAGSAYCVDSFTFGGTTPLAQRQQNCAAHAGWPKVYPGSGFREYTAECVADFTDWTEHARISAGTQAALVFTITDGTNSLVNTMNVRTVGDTPMVGGPDVVKQPLKFVGTGANPISMVLTNGDATI